MRVVPSAGPYYVASYSPGQGAILKRNPNYRGARPHHVEEIDYTVGVGLAPTVAAIEEGDVDFAADGVPSQAAATLAKRYGPESAAAKAGHQRYFSNPTLTTVYLALNTSRPLFSDVWVRRALNYAVDREELAGVGAFLTHSASPTDQLLPPGMPGFRDVRAYPFTPSLKQARQLVSGRRLNGALYVCSTAACRQAGQVIQANLRAIGIDLDVKSFPRGALRPSRKTG